MAKLLSNVLLINSNNDVTSSSDNASKICQLQKLIKNSC